MPVICILTHIGNDSRLGDGVMGNDFVKELNNIEQSGYAECEVWINSVGGSVLEGMAIYDAINNSSIIVNTRCIGVAASMAGVIFQAGKKRIMNDYSRLMIHGVSGGTPESEASLSESVVTMLSKRCPENENKIRKMMDGEKFITAQDCLDKYNLCDEVVTTGVELDLKNSGLFATFNTLTEVVNKLIQEPKQKIKMLKVTNLLNLSEDASEDSILKEITDLKEQLANKEALLNKIEEDKKEEEAKKEAVELVENSIKAGKIDEAAKEGFVALAIKDLEGTKNAISAMSVRVAAKILPIVNSAVAESRAGWDYDKWQKEDPNGLTAMYKNSRAEYDALYEKWSNTLNIK